MRRRDDSGRRSIEVSGGMADVAAVTDPHRPRARQDRLVHELVLLTLRGQEITKEARAANDSAQRTAPQIDFDLCGIAFGPCEPRQQGPETGPARMCLVHLWLDQGR